MLYIMLADAPPFLGQEDNPNIPEINTIDTWINEKGVEYKRVQHEDRYKRNFEEEYPDLAQRYYTYIELLGEELLDATEEEIKVARDNFYNTFPFLTEDELGTIGSSAIHFSELFRKKAEEQSARALDFLYEPEWDVLLEEPRGPLSETVFKINTEAVYIRLREELMINELVEFLESQNYPEGHELNFASLACGGAHPTFQAIREFLKKRPDIKINLLLIDYDQDVLDLSKKYAEKYGFNVIEGQEGKDQTLIDRESNVTINPVKANLAMMDTIPELDKKFDVIDGLGFTEYLPSLHNLQFNEFIKGLFGLSLPEEFIKNVDDLLDDNKLENVIAELDIDLDHLEKIKPEGLYRKKEKRAEKEEKEEEGVSLPKLTEEKVRRVLMGMIKYLRGLTAEVFIKKAYFLTADGGIFISSNMGPRTPEEQMLLFGAVGWPKLTLRNPETELQNVFLKAGVPAEELGIVIDDSGKYNLTKAIKQKPSF